MPKTSTDKTDNMRIDKWLWCARFYKTRSLASDAIKGGKVLVNGDRVKPSKTIEAGDVLRIRKGAFHYEISVTQLAKGRKSAADASRLYEESTGSLQKREELAAQLKANTANTPRTRGRPTKRDRRELIKFKLNR